MINLTKEELQVLTIPRSNTTLFATEEELCVVCVNRKSRNMVYVESFNRFRYRLKSKPSHYGDLFFYDYILVKYFK